MWKHTEDNPADFVSRGMDSLKLKTCELWWNGPKFLMSNQYPQRQIPVAVIKDPDSLEDDARLGKAHRVITLKMIAEVNALILNNRRITIDEIHRLLDISSQIVTGDETWGHRFEPESKRQNKQWNCATSPPPKKSKAVHTSSAKVMMSFFFSPQRHTAYRVSGTGNHHQCPVLSSHITEL
ncbi:histone-lysine N-methyltransferase SETMAR [Trichonephila clavipes]|nr:histone-lysine N-methyltransferase SETMAR [Trichonephila clavipes]